MKMELRSNGLYIEGYVNAKERFSKQLPSPRGKFVEQVVDGAWQNALDKADNVNLLFNHKENRKLGSTKEGNLALIEDSIGLKASCTITDAEVIEKAKNNELRGWSFRFSMNKDEWREQDGLQQRYLQDIDIYEVSLLSVATAYTGTSIEFRGEENLIEEQRNLEDIQEPLEKEEDKNIEESRKLEQNKIEYDIIQQEISILKIKGFN